MFCAAIHTVDTYVPEVKKVPSLAMVRHPHALQGLPATPASALRFASLNHESILGGSPDLAPWAPHDLARCQLVGDHLAFVATSAS